MSWGASGCPLGLLPAGPTWSHQELAAVRLPAPLPGVSPMVGAADIP
jgi:hypothetical protein